MTAERTLAAGTAGLAAKGLSPRGLPTVEAAAYVGLGVRSFKAAVAGGRLPQPMPLTARRPKWDRAALDAALDELSRLRPGDPVQARYDAIMAAIEGEAN